MLRCCKCLRVKLRVGRRCYAGIRHRAVAVEPNIDYNNTSALGTIGRHIEVAVVAYRVGK
jgi:hypothetical protein